MAAINLTPDSFHEPSRADASTAISRIGEFVKAGFSIIDLGGVSTRPGASPVPVEKEWQRLSPVLGALAGDVRLSGHGSCPGFRISVDTTSAEIVRRVYDTIGPFIVNDISAGEDDSDMLPTVARLGLTYIAMHKRGTPATMDMLTDYPGGVMRELQDYFRVFARHAENLGIKDWILDPGLGFAKTDAQNWEILRKLDLLNSFGHPVLIGAADKRFTHKVPSQILRWFEGKSSLEARRLYGMPMDEPEAGPMVSGEPLASGAGDVALGNPLASEAGVISEKDFVSGTDIANVLAIAGGAGILRVHHIPFRDF